ncbi:MAG: hypothetical protein ABSD29_09995 [Verrucomicrobiota bacterium]|jgi:hypothetical protein
MRNKTAIWGVLTVIGIIVLALLARPIPRPKARAQHITAVNHVSVVFSAPLTNTGTLPGARPVSGK